MITVSHLTKQFDRYTAVNDISFSVGKGEVLGFLGPNGAGKSTTMKMITGFLAPTSGDIEVCGSRVEDDPIAVKKSIGYLPEGAPAYGDMTPLRFLEFVAEIRGFSGAEKQARVETAISRANLQSVIHKPIENLSKGFKRRVGLAQSILHDPPVLIMDEPTDGLDPNQKHEVRELIAEMSKDKAIIISTHILEEVHAICSRAIIIAQGKLLFDGTPAELEAKSKYHNAVSIRFKNELPQDFEATFRNVKDVADVETISTADHRCVVLAKPGCSIVDAVSQKTRDQNWALEEMHVEAGHLDEVFRRITTQSSDVQQGALT